jgi:hypothetical protein
MDLFTAKKIQGYRVHENHTCTINIIKVIALIIVLVNSCMHMFSSGSRKI